METWTTDTCRGWSLTTGRNEGGFPEGDALALAVSSPGDAHLPRPVAYCQLKGHLL